MDTETLEEIKSWREMLEPFFNQLTRHLPAHGPGDGIRGEGGDLY